MVKSQPRRRRTSGRGRSKRSFQGGQPALERPDQQSWPPAKGQILQSGCGTFDPSPVCVNAVRPVFVSWSSTPPEILLNLEFQAALSAFPTTCRTVLAVAESELLEFLSRCPSEAAVENGACRTF